MTPNKAIRIDKSFGFTDVVVVENEALPYIKVKGYASKMIDADGTFVIDADQENVNTMGIDLSRMKDGSLPLLYGHDQSKPVGKITNAEYLSDGLVIEATLYKLPGDDMTNFVYQSVKAGVLNSFSVGILVKEFDIIEKDGEDYLQLSKSEMIETSIVAVPSNPKATFGILEVKSVGTEKSSFSTVISKSSLKAENPNVCSEFEECALATKEVQAEEKGLTYEDTKNEDWIKSMDFQKYMSTLFATIEDNWYGEKWGDVSPEEALLNIKGTFDGFLKDYETVQDIDSTKLKGDETSDKNLKGNEMVKKEVEDTPATEVVTEEETPVVATEATEEIPTETKDEIVPEETPIPVVNVAPKEEAQPKEETPAEVPVPERTLADLSEEASKLDVSAMSDDEVESIYESFRTVTDEIERLVEEQIKEQLSESA